MGMPRAAARAGDTWNSWDGSRCSWALLCPGHPALGHQSPNYSRAPVPSWLVGSGRAQGTSAPALAQRRLQERPTGTSHIPRFPPPPTFPYPQHGFGDQISSPPSPAEPEQALPRAVPAWPGCPQPPLGSWCGLLWQPLPKACCQRLPRSQLCPLSHTAPIYSWQLPGQG